jgi:hypothetical protein
VTQGKARGKGSMRAPFDSGTRAADRLTQLRGEIRLLRRSQIVGEAEVMIGLLQRGERETDRAREGAGDGGVDDHHRAGPDAVTPGDPGRVDQREPDSARTSGEGLGLPRC